MTDTTAEPLADRLASHMAVVLGVDITVEALEQITAGASRHTWRFKALNHSAGIDETLVLRMDPPDEPRSEFVAVESQVMTIARDAGVPVPDLVSCDTTGEALGAPFLVTRLVDGESLPQRILRSEELAVARSKLAAECGRILAAIHSLDIARLPAVPQTDELANLWNLYTSFPDARPAMEVAFRWLRENPIAHGAPRLVHGDFRNGNLIVGPDGVRAVLDWEQVHVGDPLQDLAWLCVRAWRFGSDLPVGGFGEYPDLLLAYEDAVGAPVDAESFRWWRIFETLRWGVLCRYQAHRHLTGTLESVNLVAIGRRTCEQEYDVLGLLPSGA